MPFSKKTFIHLISVLVLLSFGTGIGYLASRGVALAYLIINNKNEEIKYVPTSNIYLATEDKKNKRKEIEKISVGFVGDIIPSIDAATNTFTQTRPYTSKPDIMIANFEGVVTNHEYSKCKTDSKNCFSFNGNSDFLKQLKDASFDVLNIANNHFNDYDQEGQIETINEIYQSGMMPTGKKDEIVYINKNGFKIAMLGFSNYFWTTNVNNTKKVQDLINTANKYSDIVIVIFHGGGEGINYNHTPIGVEWYLNENRGDLRTFSHTAIDAGADLVLGSGPHVLRGIEKYNEKIIAYSLGNFASTDAILTSGILKNSAMLEINFDKKGNINSLQIYPFLIKNTGIPEIDPMGQSIKMINELSLSDFGDNGIILDENGQFVMK